jgi:hypothetical protein
LGGFLKNGDLLNFFAGKFLRFLLFCTSYYTKQEFFMGKKRRLNSAKAKYAAKHSSHPRAKLLAATTTQTENTDSQKTIRPTKPATTATLTPKITEPANAAPATTDKITTNVAPETKTATKTTLSDKTSKNKKVSTKKPKKAAKSRAKSKKES